jgi:hypothetical protein
MSAGAATSRTLPLTLSFTVVPPEDDTSNGRAPAEVFAHAPSGIFPSGGAASSASRPPEIALRISRIQDR